MRRYAIAMLACGVAVTGVAAAPDGASGAGSAAATSGVVTAGTAAAGIPKKCRKVKGAFARNRCIKKAKGR